MCECAVFVAAHRLSLVAASAGYALAVVRELLAAAASLVEAQSLDSRLSGCGTQA